MVTKMLGALSHDFGTCYQLKSDTDHVHVEKQENYATFTESKNDNLEM